MASTPPPVISKAGNLTVFITPPATPPPVDTPTSRSAESPRSEFSTPNSTPRSMASPASPPPEHTATSPPPPKTVSPPPPVKTVSPPLPPAKLFQASPVQVPPPQFEKAEARTDGSAFGFFWDAVLRVQEAHASLDEYISNWFGLDQSKYQWALNDYYESTGKSQLVLFCLSFDQFEACKTFHHNVPQTLVNQIFSPGSNAYMQLPISSSITVQKSKQGRWFLGPHDPQAEYKSRLWA
ncbi:hypothetical protein D1007_02583 [Hordeum vulgare]|nr:hypothetical protein D1007_02583 [Hordeum vulgare]